jgi:murein DD-endopeptidase MepM/ murein hydrolase activator NlpD
VAGAQAAGHARAVPLPSITAATAATVAAAALTAGGLAVAASSTPRPIVGAPTAVERVPPTVQVSVPLLRVSVPPLRKAGLFQWPLSPAPRVLRRFVVGPYEWSPGHRGVDLAASTGEQVLAVGPGVVTFAGRVAGRGVVVVAHAGGLRTTYEPVSPGVGVGERTRAGTPIGTLEAVRGHCAGPCLHWGALRGDVYVDPLTLLGPPARPVLLPDPGRE